MKSSKAWGSDRFDGPIFSVFSAEFSAPGMSIVKFVDGTLKSYYSRDYYTEGDVMTGVPELVEAVLGFRVYYRCAVDPTFECPF